MVRSKPQELLGRSALIKHPDAYMLMNACVSKVGEVEPQPIKQHVKHLFAWRMTIESDSRRCIIFCVLDRVFVLGLNGL